MATERSSTGDVSKTRSFIRSLLPFRKRPDARIQVDGFGLVPDEIKPKRILIVDDDAVILKTLSLKLKAAGYEVVNAIDPSDAIRAIRDDQPDFVLMDIYFPPDISHGGGIPWDGFVLMRWLRSMEQGARVPVIFITSSLAPGFKEKALAAGALALFEKPIDHSRLLALIAKGLSARNSAGSSFEI